MQIAVRDSKFHITLLEEELQRRKAKNPRYSLRAFASNLNMHPSALSRILAGKQELSLPAATLIMKKLGLDAEDQQRFVLAVAEEKFHRALSTLAGVISTEMKTPLPVASAKTGYSLESALEFSPDRIIVMGLDKRILFITPAPIEFPWSKTENILGMTAREMNFPEPLAARLDTQIDYVLSTLETSGLEFSTPENWYRAMMAPIFAESGELEALLIHMRDVTSEKVARQRANWLKDLLEKLTNKITRDQVSEIIASNFLEVSTADKVLIQVVGDDTIRVTAKKFVSSEPAGQEILCANEPGSPSLRALQNKEPIWIENMAEYAGTQMNRSPDVTVRYASGGVLPMCVGEECVGLLHYGFLTPHVFSDDEKIFLITLASIGGQALEQARLFESSELAITGSGQP